MEEVFAPVVIKSLPNFLQLFQIYIPTGAGSLFWRKKRIKSNQMSTFTLNVTFKKKYGACCECIYIFCIILQPPLSYSRLASETERYEKDLAGMSYNLISHRYSRKTDCMKSKSNNANMTKKILRGSIPCQYVLSMTNSCFPNRRIVQLKDCCCSSNMRVSNGDVCLSWLTPGTWVTLKYL